MCIFYTALIIPPIKHTHIHPKQCPFLTDMIPPNFTGLTSAFNWCISHRCLWVINIKQRNNVIMYADQCSINITQISSPAPYLQATEDSCYWNPPTPLLNNQNCKRQVYLNIYYTDSVGINSAENCSCTSGNVMLFLHKRKQ